MSIQKDIEKIDGDVLAEGVAFEELHQRIMNDLRTAEVARDERIETLRRKRDAIVMKEKLKDFPAKLVKEHTHCSICGGEMRPFNYVVGEETLRAWACQVGNLKEDHDLVHVK